MTDTSSKHCNELVKWLRNASRAIYLATAEKVADDIAPKLRTAADVIEKLDRERKT